MRKLLFASAAVAATLVAALPADAQYYSYYPSYGYSPYSYSYGYSYPAYSYSYPYYGYSYSYPSYSYSYPSYGYYGRRYRSSYYNCRPRRHHRNGIVYYTPGC